MDANLGSLPCKYHRALKDTSELPRREKSTAIKEEEDFRLGAVHYVHNFMDSLCCTRLHLEFLQLGVLHRASCDNNLLLRDQDRVVCSARQVSA